MNNLKINILFFLLFFSLWVLATLGSFYFYIELSWVKYMITQTYEFLNQEHTACVE